MALESTYDRHKDRCTQWLKSPYPRRAVLPWATLSAVLLFAHWEASMTNKHVLQRGWDWLAALLSCMQAQSWGRKRDEEKVRVGRLTKLREKARERKKQSRGEGLKTNNTHVRRGYSAHETMDWKLMGWSYTLNLMQHWQWPPESLSTIRTGFGALIFW